MSELLQTEEIREQKVLEIKKKSIVLYNDEINTFEHVIESLVDICGHNPFQAEQCALITHYKGKCSVKSGIYEDLYPYKSALNDRGLEAVIE